MHTVPKFNYSHTPTILQIGNNVRISIDEKIATLAKIDRGRFFM